MGIPSYFSYIIKNQKGIFKNILKLPEIDCFYLDSNSIIYDSMKNITSYQNMTDYETKLIQNVINIINELITRINPRKKVFITFDGVSPFAKIKQQKTRRFKTSYIKKLTDVILDGVSDHTPGDASDHTPGDSSDEDHDTIREEWDKTAITPGTKFMEKLANEIHEEYKNNKNILISCSDEIGEGEHKIFNYIRDNKEYHVNKTIVVYGLDADLIMLCLNNLKYCKQIFIGREAPEFIKSLDYELNPNELYFLDIQNLNTALTKELIKNRKPTKNLIHDYTFICFLLGNDFMPHFPSLNIRTKGIHILMSSYYNCISSKNKNIISDTKKIKWGVFKNLIKWFAENEETNIQNEYSIRGKIEKKYILNCKLNKNGVSRIEHVKDVNKRIDNVPIIMRDVELLIDPYSDGWEKRYYKYLFNSDNTEQFIKELCINYLEGLEWVMSYYTDKCIDWGWKYNYNYPPLFKDLLKYIPVCEVTMIEPNNNKPLPPIVQLAYVIPRTSFHLISEKLADMLLTKYNDLYDENIDIKWSYCRYFWEAHPEFTTIDIDKFITDILNLNTDQ